ncbi:MAG: hypothetical protein HQK57_01540 [Deltaproteobacteria bacterium]|nr:hypothetical protein [Deltaproteobacteria bacterium]MBF0523687.1 hypothetical protein [Deltaproteobacteria bacterium]
MKQNLVPIPKLPADFFVKRATLHRWRHLNNYPEIFIKFEGTLLIDMDRLEALMEAKRQG